jgi:hypothetical protein
MLSDTDVMIVMLLVWPLLQPWVEYKKRTAAGLKSGAKTTVHTREFSSQ